MKGQETIGNISDTANEIPNKLLIKLFMMRPPVHFTIYTSHRHSYLSFFSGKICLVLKGFLLKYIPVLMLPKHREGCLFSFTLNSSSEPSPLYADLKTIHVPKINFLKNFHQFQLHFFFYSFNLLNACMKQQLKSNQFEINERA